MLALGKLWIMLQGTWSVYTQQGPKAAVHDVWKDRQSDMYQMIQH